MKTLWKLPVKIILLPVILAISVISLLMKVVTNTSMFILSPVIVLCALLSIYGAFAHGFLGFLIVAAVPASGFLALLIASVAIEMVEQFNGRLIGFLRS